MSWPLWSRHRPHDRTIAALYGAIVAQARRPVFYEGYGVGDTVGGRLEMIILHLFLLQRRLRQAGAPLRRVGQGVFDRFCQDMDANFREMGISDLGVPREMRKIGEAYFGRVAAYEAALAGGDGELASALGRNVVGEGAGDPARLAAYVRASDAALAAQGEAALAAGQMEFPDPDTICADRAMAG